MIVIGNNAGVFVHQKKTQNRKWLDVMEDDEGERKTKTISFTVTEDGFDVDEQAILDALIDREIESRNGDCSRPEALSEVLFTAVITLGELFLGEDRVDEIMDEAFERKRELEKAAVGPPRPPEL